MYYVTRRKDKGISRAELGSIPDRADDRRSKGSEDSTFGGVQMEQYGGMDGRFATAACSFDTFSCQIK